MSPSPTLQDLEDRRIVLGLTGGIAAYKSAELTRRLQDHGATVQVVMTEAATHFITPVTMQALSGRPVYVSQWDPTQPNNMAHINLSREADAIVVAPASADFMAKLAHGRCDDLLSTLCIARRSGTDGADAAGSAANSCPLLLAPAMNREMWAHPATQRNAAQLRSDGAILLGPGSGDQACGEVGDGRMLEANEILEDLIAFFQPKLLAGKRMLVTAGPTFEPIDPVRGITNLSSGKMGYAIARAAREAGAEVTLVSGPTGLTVPRGVRRVDVRTAREMLDAVTAEMDMMQVFVGVAAVADWTVANSSEIKLKKGKGVPAIELVPTVDILSTVAARATQPGERLFCVGFAAETNDLATNAEAKRKKKRVPMMVGNIAQDALGASDNELVVYEDAGTTSIQRADKLTLARQLVALVAKRLA